MLLIVTGVGILLLVVVEMRGVSSLRSAGAATRRRLLLLLLLRPARCSSTAAQLARQQLLERLRANWNTRAHTHADMQTCTSVNERSAVFSLSASDQPTAALPLPAAAAAAAAAWPHRCPAEWEAQPSRCRWWE